MGSKVDLEKFTGQNDFNIWKIKMKALLITQGLGEAIDPVSKLEGGESSSSKTPEQVAKMDKKAKSTIILSLSDSVIREVAKEKIVAGLWAKLENLYMTKSLANRLYIKKKMFSLKMIEEASLNEHVDEFNIVCDELETIDEGLSDDSKALLLISSLPKSYKHFVDTLLYRRQTLSLEEVKSALGTKKLKDKQDNPESESSEGVMARGRPEKRESRGKKQDRSKSKQKNLKCFHCHKEGHFKRHCPERKNKNKETKERTGNTAIAIEEEGSFETAGVLIATSQKPQGQWVLDSGCTFHMCPNRSYFTTYQPCDGGMVLMGNNSMCKVVGIGTVSLRMFDGCVIKAKKGVLRVIKGSMVIMKGIKQNGMYVMDGHTIVGEASVTDSGGNISMMWHLRMGHMSERGLRELQKQGVFGNDQIGALGFCEDCILGKSSKLRFETATYTTKEKLGYKHFDLWGTEQVNSLGETLRTDNGLEYCNKLFEEFCEKNEALNTACYLVNRSPSTAIVRHASIRIILALVAIQDMHLEHMDVKTAFLHGELQKKIVTQQPEGCSYDCCVYFKETSRGGMIYLLLYVDDMLIACHDREEINHLKNLLSREFEMKELGEAKRILGMDIIINKSKKSLLLTQQSYIRKVLVRFGMNDAKQVHTPLASHFKLSAAQPDISHAVSLVSKFIANPGYEHWRAVQWIMRYLKRTLEVGLIYGGEDKNGHTLICYVDADFAGDLDKRRSQTGYLFTLEGCTVSWKATLQNIVALSTIEAEYTAAAEALKETIWLKGMITELEAKQEYVTVYSDSQSAIHLSKNQSHHEKTKHIDVKLHFVRFEVSRGAVKLLKIHTEENLADMLTKVVPTAKFILCMNLAVDVGTLKGVEPLKFLVVLGSSGCVL
ncbi:Integrase catalytic domain-containing protein [Citrus sinensis]|uniref:Integrase catalytic domain-containing protein n=1 Tax=Citrus sinensis TaxID=2711 RepID=A0ACB8K962_CITSI|nr:Integrase catalytic domain-containing protein [Citrus sinensis]